MSKTLSKMLALGSLAPDFYLKDTNSEGAYFSFC